MEHLNESISAGERAWRVSRTSLLLPHTPTCTYPRSPRRASPPKLATPPSGNEGTPSRQMSTNASPPTVPTLAEESLRSAGRDKDRRNVAITRVHLFVDVMDESLSAVELVQDYMERVRENIHTSVHVHTK